MGSRCAGLLSNRADGRQCKVNGLRHRKQCIHSYHLLGCYYLSYTLSQCTPLTGVLEVRSPQDRSLQALQGAFGWKLFLLKLSTHSCQCQGNKAPIQHSFLPQVRVKPAQLPPVRGILGRIKHSRFRMSPLVQSYDKRRQAGRWCRGVWPEPHSRDTARGAGDGSQHCAAPWHGTSRPRHRTWGCIQRLHSWPAHRLAATLASVACFSQVLLNTIIHRKP